MRIVIALFAAALAFSPLAISQASAAPAHHGHHHHHHHRHHLVHRR